MDYYYTDLNDIKRDLITLYPEIIDVYRDDRQFQKFTAGLGEIMKERPSEFAIVLSQLVSDTQDLLNKHQRIIDGFENNRTFSPSIHETMKGMHEMHYNVTRNFVSNLLRNGMPNKKAAKNNRELMDEFLEIALDCLTDSEFSHLVVARNDRRFMQKALDMNDRVTTDSELTDADVKQYIGDTGIGKYFNDGSNGRAPDEDASHLSIGLSAFHNEKDLMQLWAYNDLYEDIKQVYVNARETLRTHTNDFCQLRAEELKHYPNILPGKCKLLVTDAVHKISENSKLEPDELTALLTTKYKALRMKLDINDLKMSEEAVLINDPAVMKIIDSKEAKADKGRGD